MASTPAYWANRRMGRAVLSAATTDKTGATTTNIVDILSGVAAGTESLPTQPAGFADPGPVGFDIEVVATQRMAMDAMSFASVDCRDPRPSKDVLFAGDELKMSGVAASTVEAAIPAWAEVDIDRVTEMVELESIWDGIASQLPCDDMDEPIFPIDGDVGVAVWSDEPDPRVTWPEFRMIDWHRSVLIDVGPETWLNRGPTTPAPWKNGGDIAMQLPPLVVGGAPFSGKDGLFAPLDRARPGVGPEPPAIVQATHPALLGRSPAVLNRAGTLRHAVPSHPGGWSRAGGVGAPPGSFSLGHEVMPK